MKYSVEVATKKNSKIFSKANEDRTFVDLERGIFIILDGVTRDQINGVYPDPSPAVDVSELFIKKSYQFIVENLTQNKEWQLIIKEAFAEGNSAIKQYNYLYEGDFLPGTVGIIVVVRDNKLFYGYIGDCIGVLLNEHEKFEFTECQTKLVHEHVKEFSADQIRNQICNNILHPYSYGVLDGRDGALDFVITGELDLGKYKEIILLTDGAEGVIRQFSSKELFMLNVTELLNNAICDKSTDDKTVIIVRRKFDENVIENI